MKLSSIPPQVVVVIISLLSIHQGRLYGQSQSEIVVKFEKRSHTYKTTTLPYRLFIPEQYASSQQYPLVLALHGLGECGTDNETQMQFRLATSWADTISQNRWPSFVVVPQCPSGNRWVDWYGGYFLPKITVNSDFIPISNELETVNDLLESLIKEYSIDTDRLYITGLSMGGIGVWDMIARFPSKFAAAIPMCGAGDTSKVDLFKEVSIWDFHGRLDESVLVQCSRIIFSTMELHDIEVFYTTGLNDNQIALDLNNGAKHIYTEYPNGTHAIWDQSYDYPLLFPWVFAQTRKTSAVLSARMDSPIVHQFHLDQNYPNPFNPATTIHFSLSRSQKVSLKLYDLLGNEVASLIDDEIKSAGDYRIEFNAGHLVSGVYMYRLQTEDFMETRKMVLIK